MVLLCLIFSLLTPFAHADKVVREIKIGSSWAISSGIQHDWRAAETSGFSPGGLLVLNNKNLQSLHVTFVDLRTEGGKNVTAAALCRDRKAADDKIKTQNFDHYKIVKIDGRPACEITSQHEAFSEQLLLPGHKEFAQISIYYGFTQDLAKKYVASLLKRLRYVR